MKYLLTLLILFFAFDVSAQIRGTLLKSNGKPLAYTEIELVPTYSKKMVMDGRFFATSSSSGKFSFVNLPPDKYTLSINFNDSPTDLSPYPTYFYPNAESRDQAEIFEIADSNATKTILFKLPPAFVAGKIKGNIVFSDGKPVVGAYLSLRDTVYNYSVGSFGNSKTDSQGNFTITGFLGREYQIGAFAFDCDFKKPCDVWNKLIGVGESKIFTLETATPVIKFTLRQSKDVEKIRDKYVADLIWNENIFSD